MEAWIIWLIAAVILLTAEILTLTLWLLCLSAGSLLSMAVALLGGGIEFQLVTLVVGTFLAYLLLLPVFRRRKAGYRQKSDEDSRTGMEALLGRRAFVTKEIKPGELGRARIDGDNWQVRAPGVNEVIAHGSEVVVTGYDSIILDVAKSNQD